MRSCRYANALCAQPNWDEGGVAELKLFYLINGSLIEQQEAELLYGAEGLPAPLTPHELVKTILIMSKGQQTTA